MNEGVVSIESQEIPTSEQLQYLGSIMLLIISKQDGLSR